MKRHQESSDQTGPQTIHKSRLAIVRDYFFGGKGNEFDTYRDPALYDAGAHSSLYRRDNLARGMADVVEGAMPEGREARILDIGAGTGILSLELARRDHHVTALDLFPAPLARLQEKAAAEGLAGNLTPEQGDMNQGLPFPDGSFNTVVSLRATRYINNFGAWLSEIERVLEPGGSFVLPVFGVDTIPWKRHSELGIHQPTSVRGVMGAVVDAGFEIADVASYSQAVDQGLGERDVPFYYKPTFIVAETPRAAIE